MNERITLISLFDEDNLAKIFKITNPIKEPMCKIPFGKNVKDRIENDTLPYHFTLFSWDIKKEREVLQYLRTIKLTAFKIMVDKLDIMSGNEHSYVLYFNIAPSKELKELQTIIYNYYQSQYYNPNHFKFHITIHIDKDYERTLNLKKQLEKNFIPFELEVNTLALFEIYPAKQIMSL